MKFEQAVRIVDWLDSQKQGTITLDRIGHLFGFSPREALVLAKEYADARCWPLEWVLAPGEDKERCTHREKLLKLLATADMSSAEIIDRSGIDGGPARAMLYVLKREGLIEYSDKPGEYSGRKVKLYRLRGAPTSTEPPETVAEALAP